MLGARCTEGVEGTDKDAWTAVSVLSVSRTAGIGVFGFSCFCCTASSCRRSTKEATQSKPLEYVSTEIKTGEDVLLKRLFPLWKWSKVTCLCSISEWTLKAFLDCSSRCFCSRKFSFCYLALIFIPKQGPIWDRELTCFQKLQAGKQRHIKTEARQLGTPWLYFSSPPGWDLTHCTLLSSTLVSTRRKPELRSGGSHTTI